MAGVNHMGCCCGEAGCDYCGGTPPANLTLSLSDVVPHVYTCVYDETPTDRAAHGYDFSAIVCANVLDAEDNPTCVWESEMDGSGEIVARVAPLNGQGCCGYGPAYWKWIITRTADAYEVRLKWGTEYTGGGSVFSGITYTELVATISLESGCGAATGTMTMEWECFETGYHYPVQGSAESYGRPIETADIAITVGP
jgi:hypothetical protein